MTYARGLMVKNSLLVIPDNEATNAGVRVCSEAFTFLAD